MPTFPIPVFVACALALVGLRLWRQKGRADLLVVLLLLCALQSLIIALNQHYGVAGLHVVQPLVAALIPAAAWLAYRGRTTREDLVHGLGPLTTAAALVVAPPFLDVVLPVLFVLYGGLILISAKDGADAQPNARLASGDLPARIWLVIGAALVATALSDALIVATQIAGYAQLRPWIISVFSVGNLLVIGALSFSPHLDVVADDEPAETPPAETPPAAAPSPAVADPEIWQRVQALMQSERPYLDPDLTLSRLSRRLGVPTKPLSATINQATGENVSRFINAARIAAAQRALLDGESITNAMLMSGFNTKSNFNREFLRIVGTNPSAWLTATKAQGPQSRQSLSSSSR